MDVRGQKYSRYKCTTFSKVLASSFSMCIIIALRLHHVSCNNQAIRELGMDSLADGQVQIISLNTSQTLGKQPLIVMRPILDQAGAVRLQLVINI